MKKSAAESASLQAWSLAVTLRVEWLESLWYSLPVRLIVSFPHASIILGKLRWRRVDVAISADVRYAVRPAMFRSTQPLTLSGMRKWVPVVAYVSYGAKAGMAHSVYGWTRGVQVKLWDPLITRVIPERLRGVYDSALYKCTFTYLLTYDVRTHNDLMTNFRRRIQKNSSSSSSSICHLLVLTASEAQLPRRF